MAHPLSSFWTWLRAVTGDSAYEEHVARARHGNRAALTREEFYLDALRRKYAGTSRCC